MNIKNGSVLINIAKIYVKTIIIDDNNIKGYIIGNKRKKKNILGFNFHALIHLKHF